MAHSLSVPSVAPTTPQDELADWEVFRSGEPKATPREGAGEVRCLRLRLAHAGAAAHVFYV
jgi:hypothetical protein